VSVADGARENQGRRHPDGVPMKLAAKLTLLLLACAVVPLVGVSALSFVSAKGALSEPIGACSWRIRNQPATGS